MVMSLFLVSADVGQASSITSMNLGALAWFLSPVLFGLCHFIPADIGLGITRCWFRSINWNYLESDPVSSLEVKMDGKSFP